MPRKAIRMARMHGPVGDLVTENGAGGGVHNKPDVAFDAADLNIGFIGSEYRRFRVIIMVNKGFDDHGGCSGIVGNLLVRDADAIEVMEGLCGLAQGKLEVHMHGKTQGHDVSVMLRELEGGGVPGQGI